MQVYRLRRDWILTAHENKRAGNKQPVGLGGTFVALKVLCYELFSSADLRVSG